MRKYNLIIAFILMFSISSFITGYLDFLRKRELSELTKENLKLEIQLLKLKIKHHHD